MRIVTARRISQVFFGIVFFWLCLASTLGADFWRLSGWPINFFFNLDPLNSLVTLFSTGKWYGPLWWGALALLATIALGRVFCGFVCPLGALNQFFGWLGKLGRDRAYRAAANRQRKASAVKYYLLAFFLLCALFGSVQSGLIDPFSLLTRGVNLGFLPWLDGSHGWLSDEPRRYDGVWVLGGLLIAVLGLNFSIPRFFCRFVCPLGALFGLFSAFSPWRMGKSKHKCGDCTLCEEHCEGACRPSGKIITSECLLCFNCLEVCPASRMRFATQPSAGHETALPDLSRRALLFSAATGAATAAMFATTGQALAGRNPELIRPPGSLDEERFLTRCLRCGQCMRACPSNIIQPAILQAGMQGLWTPRLDYRMGRSGCQINCVTCGQVCPTAAIKPLSLDEKLGRASFKEQGPIRVGAAFVDRTRCLPWVSGKPCIVCQELCPVSPKAIYTRTVYEVVRGGEQSLTSVNAEKLEIANAPLASANLASGDYGLRLAGSEAEPMPIAAAWGRVITLAKAPAPGLLSTGAKIEIVVKLQRPYVDLNRCIGCGMCEHECPISGLRGIRVYAENETRAKDGRMLA